MKLNNQHRIAANILKCSEKKIWLDPDRLSDIKEAITKVDIRSLIKEGVIRKKPAKGVSRVRARKILEQKRKGRQKGQGSKKGKRTARLSKKRGWINKIRAQRILLNDLRGKKKISKKEYRDLYIKAKGGFFRSKRHIMLYIEEHGLKK